MTDGGPAFPVAYKHDYPYPPSINTETHLQEWGGMSLRDYFAAAALQGLLSNSVNMEAVDRVSDANRMSGSTATATWAYLLADAMLKAREQ